MSDLVGNPEDRFSRVEAQVVFVGSILDFSSLLDETFLHMPLAVDRDTKLTNKHVCFKQIGKPKLLKKKKIHF